MIFETEKKILVLCEFNKYIRIKFGSILFKFLFAIMAVFAK